MSELKDFKVDWAGIWIPKKELMRIRDNENDEDLTMMMDEMIYQIDKFQPVPMDPEVKEHAKELQKRLMQCTIDFFKEKGILDIWSVNWEADDIFSSVKAGEWIPSSDSSITLERLTSDGRIPVAFVL